MRLLGQNNPDEGRSAAKQERTGCSMAKERKQRPFGIRDKLGYFFGDFGNDFTFILSTIILMKFYTDVVGISAGAEMPTTSV